MTQITQLFLASLAACALGAGVSMLSRTHARRALVAFATVAALLAATAALGMLGGAPTVVLALWPLATLGHLWLVIDPLSALFMLVTALVFLAGAPYAAREARRMEGRLAGVFGACYLMLLATILIVLAAGDVASFVIAWEAMSLLIFGLVHFGTARKARQRGAYLMLAMSEAGAIAGAIGLLLLAIAARSTEFQALRDTALSGVGLGWAVFLLTFLGFGVKAGLVPVNQWLPEAYSAAPRAFAPVLAGATTNVGVYAILRINADLIAPVSVTHGLVVLVVGSLSALIGILYATVQTDMRRLLAHSSIENMGIVVAGIGAAMTFAAAGHAVVAGIAFIAALYHMLNHSLYKTLLFIGAGAVESAAATRDLDRLGGLIHRMPWIASLFLVGVLGIAGLPPLNGFVSEWLTLQTMLRAAVLSGIGPKVVFALSGAALALTAGLAVTCFVKLFAMGFLGMPRSAKAVHASDGSAGARYPMAGLALACLLLGVTPTYVIPVLDGVAAPLAGESATDALVPDFFHAQTGDARGMSPAFVAEFHDLGAQTGSDPLPGRFLIVLHRGAARNPVVFAMSTAYMALVLAALLALAAVVFRRLARGRVVSRGAAWDGGLRALDAAITYTATGFSNPVRVVFDAVLRPTTHEDTTHSAADHFRSAVRRERAEVHIVERWVLGPAVVLVSTLARLVRRMHHGRVNAYTAYVLLALIVALAAGAAR